MWVSLGATGMSCHCSHGADCFGGSPEVSAVPQRTSEPSSLYYLTAPLKPCCYVSQLDGAAAGAEACPTQGRHFWCWYLYCVILY